MRELVLVKYCDTCYREAIAQDPDSHPMQTPATREFSIAAIEGDTKPTPKLIDVCDVHAKPYDDLILAIAQIGQMPTPAKEKELMAKKPLPPPTYTSPSKRHFVHCPVCAQGVNRSSLVGHVWAKHRTDQRPDAPTQCPECKAHYDSATGCAAHRRMAHEFDALAEVLSGVKGFKMTGRESDTLKDFHR